MTVNERAERIIKRYNELKERRMRLEERRNMYLETMKKTYGIDTEEELASEISKTEKALDKLNARIEPMLDKLERGLGL